MKQAPLALVLASALFALAGAVFFVFVRSTASTERAAAASSAESTAELESRLSEALGRIEELETKLARLASRPAPIAAGAPVAKPKAAENESAGDGDAPAKTSESTAAVATALGAKADDLRGFVKDVIQEEREERAQESKRKAEERRKEMEELAQGPWGQFNYRVNTLGKKLGFSDSQKERYGAHLTDYSSRIEEIRQGLDRNDPVAYAAYKERKQAITDEFDGQVIHLLTPDQAKTYQDLPSHEKSPAQENAAGGGSIVFSTPVTEDVKGMVIRSTLDSVGLSAGLAPPAPSAGGVTATTTGGIILKSFGPDGVDIEEIAPKAVPAAK